MQNVLILRVETPEAARGVLHALAHRSGDEGFKLEAGRVVHRDSNGRMANLEDVAEGAFSGATAGATIGAVVGMFSGPLTLLLGGAASAAIGASVSVADAEDARR